MSTCPELDLLSVYIDKELPRQYEQKLEEHLSTCSECKNQLNKMQFLHSTLQEDACAISFSDSELDESFLRLKTKMNYKSVTTPTGFQFSSFARWSMPVITVAALFLAVILPIRANKNSPAQIISQPQVFSGINASNQQNMVSLRETGVAREASLYSTTPISKTGERLTTATIDIFRPDLSQTITISINLSGFVDFNSQTTPRDVILPTSFIVDVEK